MTIEFRDRKTVQIQGTLWMSLPIEWVKHHCLSKGRFLRLTLAEDGDKLVVEPIK